MSAHTSGSTHQPSSTGLDLAAACGAGVLWGSGALLMVAVFGRSLPWRRIRPLIGTVVMAGVAMAGYVLQWFQGIEKSPMR